MRRLLSHEFMALQLLDQEESYCIGEIDSEAKHVLADTFKALLKLRLVIAEVGDDGPTFSLTPLGREKISESS